ncbi:MAG: L-cystine uptake protein TcyP (sodium:dicarboxylate symporter family) [Glaciecola sp.]|jgi:hypothetical protein
MNKVVSWPILLIILYILFSFVFSYFYNTSTQVIDLILEWFGFNPKFIHLSAGFFIAILLQIIVFPLLFAIAVNRYLWSLNTASFVKWGTYLAIFSYSILCTYNYVFGWYE